jgi:hypothetical protein
MTRPEHTDAAVDAVLAAVAAPPRFAEWLAHVLAAAAAELGSTAALTADRPGSWESDLVDRLVRGTVGHNDEYLSDYRRPT